MNIHVFAYLGKMFAFTRWLNYGGGGGGVDEMDIMNQAEVIYDNSCFLYFVCLTYNLTIVWQTETKVRLGSHKKLCIIGNDELATYFDQIMVGELSKSMRHEGSNVRASDNVRRGGWAFRLNKN